MFFEQISFRVIQKLAGDDAAAKAYGDDYQGVPMPAGLAALDGCQQLLPLAKPWEQHSDDEKKDVCKAVSNRLMLDAAPTHSMLEQVIESHSTNNKPPWRITKNGGSRKVVFAPAGQGSSDTVNHITFAMKDGNGVEKKFTITEEYWVEMLVG
ncbi:MAG: hypothetical protein AAF957_25815 [Planctomycetota bacterium]